MVVCGGWLKVPAKSQPSFIYSAQWQKKQPPLLPREGVRVEIECRGENEEGAVAG